MKHVIFAIVAGLASLGTSTIPASAVASDAFPYVWVQYAKDGGRLVRVVLDANQSCPSIDNNNKSTPMDTRKAPWTKPDGTLLFKQTVCSAIIDANSMATVAIAGTSHNLPPIPKTLEKVVVVGDTGCRMKSGWFQDCNNAQGFGPTSGWPLPTIMKNIANQLNDNATNQNSAILQMGDYHYREIKCGENWKCGGSPWSDGGNQAKNVPPTGQFWESWRDDWLNPAKPALLSAPWVMLRGNHENCTRGWRGYQLFMSQEPVGAANDQCPELEPSYKVELQTAKTGQITLAVLDTANNGETMFNTSRCAPWMKEVQARVAEAAADPASSWLTLHHPVFKWLTDNGPAAVTPASSACSATSPYLQARGYVRQVIDDQVQAGHAAPGMVFSGHSHMWQWNKPTEAAMPYQMVVGHGGTKLDKPSFYELPANARGIGNHSTTNVYPQQNKSWVTMDVVFGYQVVTRIAQAAGTWRIDMFSLAGSPPYADVLKRVCLYGTTPAAAGAVAGTLGLSASESTAATADLSGGGCYVPAGQTAG